MKDWLRVFLPLWVLGTIAWLATGFILMPEAFRRPVFYSPSGAWTSTYYDPTTINFGVLRALSIVIGPPILVVLIAIVVVAVEQIRGVRGPGKR